jgi:hypothetical protein
MREQTFVVPEQPAWRVTPQSENSRTEYESLEEDTFVVPREDSVFVVPVERR